MKPYYTCIDWIKHRNKTLKRTLNARYGINKISRLEKFNAEALPLYGLDTMQMEDIVHCLLVAIGMIHGYHCLKRHDRTHRLTLCTENA